MAQSVSLWGATYSNVPAILVPKTGGGNARFTDVTPTTAGTGDVTSGKIFFDANGEQKTGTASGGSGMNWQICNANGRVNQTSYTDVSGITLTVSVTGKYNVYWTGFRSSTSSGTNGSQLYINGTAYGSAQTSFSNTYIQTPKLTNVSLTKDDVLTIRARSRSNNSYMCIGNLVIEQTS